ncbi:MAG: hypothetical protein IT425_05880 [Pirellulales bacterium]|nr:hypothetical protein [Pirellulales bacterium]
MNSTDLVRPRFKDACPPPVVGRRPSPRFSTELAGLVRHAIARARQFMLSEQRADGSWQGDQAADASVPSLLIVWQTFVGKDPTDLLQHTERRILELQLAGGGWARHPHAGADLSTSVLAYLALKLVGADPTSEPLARARRAIRRLGGADRVDATTRYLLALFGQIDYEHCPPVVSAPFDSRLLPTTACHAVTDSENDRTSLPLAPTLPASPRDAELEPFAVLGIHRPVWNAGLERGVRELFIRPPREWPPVEFSLSQQPLSQQHGPEEQDVSPQSIEIETSERETNERAVHERAASERAALPAIEVGSQTFDQLVWRSIALRAIGQGNYQGEYQEEECQPLGACERKLSALASEHGDGASASFRCVDTRLADTVLAAQCLLESGLPAAHPAVAKAFDWLDRESVSLSHDCGVQTARLLAAFHAYANASDSATNLLPPEIEIWDDSRGECREQTTNDRTFHPHKQAHLARLLKLQNADGGWGAENGGERLGLQSSPHQTGQVLEAMALVTLPEAREACARAAAFLRQAQQADGSWTEPAHAADVESTAASLRGLIATAKANKTSLDDSILAGVYWLVVHQLASGGWATSSADDLSIEAFPSEDISTEDREPHTSTGTALALVALVEAGQSHHLAARRAVEFLLERQEPWGHWLDPHFTTHDAHAARWYGNELVSAAWPLVALSRWLVGSQTSAATAASKPTLRLVCPAD